MTRITEDPRDPYCGSERKQELDMESILEEARKTVQPIIDRERENEYVPSSVFDFKMR